MNNNLNLKVTTNMDKATNSMKKFKNALSGTGTAFNGANKNLNRLQGSFRNLNADANRSTTALKGFNKTLGGANFLANIYMINRLSMGFAKCVNSTMDMIEVTNLFNVAMGTMATETNRALVELSEVSGLDLTNLQQAVGTYNLLARSMGFSAQQASILSMNTTKLALDLSSLTNIPFEQAMADLKSGLIGQTETVYKYGIDLTEATLKQEAMNLGIDKSVRNMGQGEKMALRYSVMIRQTALAQGDFANTIEQPANQLRLLKENFVTLARSIGSVFIPILSRVLPYLRAIVMVLSELFSMLASVLGFMKPTIEDTGGSLGGVSEDIDNVGDSADKTAKKLKQLQAPFDELNALNDDSSSGADGALSGMGIDGLSEEMLATLREYDNLLGKVKQKANEIRDKIMEWLGFQKVVNEETGETNWLLKDGYTNLEKIRDIVILIGVSFLAWKIASGVLTALPFITRLLSDIAGFLLLVKEYGLVATLKGLFPIIEKIGVSTLGWVGILAIAVTRFYTLYQKSESFRKGIERIGDIFKTVWGVIDEQIIQPLIESLKTFGEYLLDLIPESWKENILNFWKKFKEIVDLLDLDFGDLLITLGGIGLLFTGGGAPFGLALLGIEALTLAIRGLGLVSDEEFESFRKGLEEKLTGAIEWMKTDFVDFFKNLPENIKSCFNTLKEKISTWWGEFKQMMSTKCSDTINAVLTFFNELPSKIGYAIGYAIGTLITWGYNMGETAKAEVPKIIEKVVTFFKELPTKIKEKIDKFKTTISDWVEDCKEWVKEYIPKICSAIVDIFNKLPSTMFNVGKNILKGIWNGICSMGSWLMDKIGSFFGGLGEGVVDGLGIGKGSEEVITPITFLARGGMLQNGMPFVAGENGKSELVGSHKGQTTVMPLENSGFVSAMYDAVYSAVAGAMGEGGNGGGIIENVLMLDGETIYRNQQKVASNKGLSLGNINFQRG